jgi:hypothetical protein
MQQWRAEIYAWADRYARGMCQREGVLGVVIGGSIARRQIWRHSDLELGTLLEARDERLSYFNVDAGRGVEIIQLLRAELAEQVARAENGDSTAIASWPIQLWKARLVSDPTGLLSQFKRLFDGGLFSPGVVRIKLQALSATARQRLGEARQSIAAGQLAKALVRARWAMNDLILIFHWTHAELPRSQSRTDSRLRGLCRKYERPDFYELYRRVFALADTHRVVRKDWPLVRQQALDLTAAWGASTRDFFDYAVDSHFTWRQNAGILTVYRLFVPVIGGATPGILEQLDDPAWQADHPALLSFLGLGPGQTGAVAALVDQLDAALGALESFHAA